MRSAGVAAAFFAALSFPALAGAGSARWSLAVAPQAVIVWPSGGFGAPPADPLLHLAGRALLRRGDSPLALRIEGGGARLRTRVAGVEVAWPTPAFRSTLRPVRAGDDLAWLAGGVQWGPASPDGGLYAFATGGAARVRPAGAAEVGPDVSFDLAGLPASTTTWRLAAGGGLAIPLGTRQHAAFVSEVEYARGGDVDSITMRGVDGAYPDPHYASARSRLALLQLHFGVELAL